MLEIKNLKVTVGDSTIINGLNLSVKKGEVHAIMGPNGSGKSTLSKVVAGHPQYQIKEGSLLYTYQQQEIDLSELSPEERARKGIFMGLQYPIEIPGITNIDFFREAFNAICEEQGVAIMEENDFKKLVISKAKELELDASFLDRAINEGFSGGEKKKNEILQMSILTPKLALLDETDSGLDIDALKVVANGINKMRSKHNAIILITHYQRLLDYIKPDFVHILQDGKLTKTGDKTLALELEKRGYEWIVS